MGEKVYRPIMKDGDHLAKSKSNPGRVRGVAFDDKNKNPDIVEWEEIDVDDLGNTSNNDNTQGQLTQEEEQMANVLGVAVAERIVDGVCALNKKIISPLWKQKVKPRIDKRIGKNTLTTSDFSYSKTQPSKRPSVDYSELSSQIDLVFNEFYSDMNFGGTNKQILNQIHYILGAVNNIKISNNLKIKKECQNETQFTEQQITAEKFLAEKTAAKINSLLLYYNVQFDIDTSKELYVLIGGGIWKNDEYLPATPDKVCQFLKAH